MAYQRIDGTMSFLPSRFEAQAMLSEIQKKKDEEMKLLRLKQAEEQKQQTEALRSELNRMLTELRAMTANREATMSQFVSQTSIPPRPPFPPPEPPDIRKSRQDLMIKAPDPPDFNQSELISAIQTPNKLTLRYSCEEIHERMTNGLCIFCEELDTPGHYNLKHKRSKICLVECVDDRLPDEELVEPAVEEISNKSVNMIQVGESNPENESRPEVSVSQSQVSLSSMEPSRRCRNISLDVVDERMRNELVCEEDGDSIITMSTKFSETYEDPRFELVCLKQSHDPVEIHLDNSESALTRSSLRHTPTYQYRAPFNPYQICNDKCDRESEEIEDDELKDKQPEDEVFGVDVEILVLNEDEQPLECAEEKNAVTSSILCDYNIVCDRQAVLETEKIEVSDDNEIVSIDEESDLVVVEEIVVASVLKFPTTFTCMRVLGHYKIRKAYILIDPGDATSGNNILTGHKCGDLENWSLRLEDNFYNIKNQQQHVNNRKVILRLVIPVIVERAVKRRKDYDGALLPYDTVAFSSLDVQQLRKQQLDTLLKLVRMTVVPFGTLILMTCKVKKLMNAEDDVKKGKWRFSEDIKLGKLIFSEYVKLIYFLELAIIAFISQGLREEKSWTIFIKIMKTFSPLIKDTHWDKEAWVKLNLESCKGGSLLEFLKRHEARVNMIKVPNNTKFFKYLKFLVMSYILRIVAALKGCKFVKFTMEQSEKPLITVLSYEMFHSPRPPELSCCKEDEQSFVLDLITEQVHDWSFFGLLLQWKWHPPPHATSELHQAHNDKPVFHL